MKFADLHLHTQFSDGTFTPEELAGHGARLGFAALALTDHDTVEGCARMAAACARRASNSSSARNSPPNTTTRGPHPRLFSGHAKRRLLTEIARFQAVRQNRIREMVARAQQTERAARSRIRFCAGQLQIAGPAACRPRAGEGRAFAVLDEAFERFLKKNRPAWVPKAKMSALEALN
jgi:hypothetical protein